MRVDQPVKRIPLLTTEQKLHVPYVFQKAWCPDRILHIPKLLTTFTNLQPPSKYTRTWRPILSIEVPNSAKPNCQTPTGDKDANDGHVQPPRRHAHGFAPVELFADRSVRIAICSSFDGGAFTLLEFERTLSLDYWALEIGGVGGDTACTGD